jgi:cell wall-associated NlpC family hydrolase
MLRPRPPAIVHLLCACGAALALSGCASTGAVPRPFPRPGAAAPPPEAEPAPAPGTAAVPALDGYSIAGTALRFRGVPYRNGGESPSGFDCSGLVWYVFAEYGVKMPRTAADQFRTGQPIGEDQVQPGDLVFFSTVAPGASHVGIAIGGDAFVHAPSEHGDVRVDHLEAPYWADRFVGARRLTTRPGAAPSASDGGSRRR